jgi:hypothetical protein
MKLRFAAREDLLVREAGTTYRAGSPARYYGRSFDAATRGYPANAEPYAVEAESDDGQRSAKQCRKGALWAADKETAAAVGVEFVEIEHAEGAWTAKAKSAASRAAASRASTARVSE